MMTLETLLAADPKQMSLAALRTTDPQVLDTYCRQLIDGLDASQRERMGKTMMDWGQDRYLMNALGLSYAKPSPKEWRLLEFVAYLDVAHGVPFTNHLRN